MSNTLSYTIDINSKGLGDVNATSTAMNKVCEAINKVNNTISPIDKIIKLLSNINNILQSIGNNGANSFSKLKQSATSALTNTEQKAQKVGSEFDKQPFAKK